ncbi:MAG: hypothetical protein J0L75_11095 [Spirochaetes bacterium]|nr:hypothetical protein [Spirochaetota bacterium]
MADAESVANNSNVVHFKIRGGQDAPDHELGELGEEEFDYIRALAARMDLERQMGAVNALLFATSDMGWVLKKRDLEARIRKTYEITDRHVVKRMAKWVQGRSGLTFMAGGGAIVKFGAHVNAKKVFFFEPTLTIGLVEFKGPSYFASIGADLGFNFYLFTVKGLGMYLGATAAAAFPFSALYQMTLGVGGQWGLQYQFLFAQVGLYYDPLHSGFGGVKIGMGLRI